MRLFPFGRNHKRPIPADAVSPFPVSLSRLRVCYPCRSRVPALFGCHVRTGIEILRVLLGLVGYCVISCDVRVLVHVVFLLLWFGTRHTGDSCSARAIESESLLRVESESYPTKSGWQLSEKRKRTPAISGTSATSKSIVKITTSILALDSLRWPSESTPPSPTWRSF